MKMLRYNTIVLIFLIVLMILTTNTVFASGADQIVFRFGHMNAPDNVSHVAALEFAKLVEEKTNGRVKVEVYPAGQLGNLQELVEGVQQGTITFCHNTMGSFATLLDEIGAFDTPYLFRDLDHALKVANINSPIIKRLNEELVATRGVRMITFYFSGTRHLTCDRPIYNPDDLKGLKIRSIPFKMFTAAVEALGAIATPINWSEVPTALATGIVQGQENPYVSIVAAKLYELQSHIMETGHIQQLGAYIVNEKTWQGLDKETQNAILEAADAAGKLRMGMVLKDNEAFKQICIDAGVTIITPENGLDIEAFRQSAKKLVEERFGDEYKQFYEEIEALK